MKKYYKINALNEAFSSSMISRWCADHGGVMKKNNIWSIVDTLKGEKGTADAIKMYMEIYMNSESDMQLDKITDEMIYGFFEEPYEVYSKLSRREHSSHPFMIVRRDSKMNLRGFDIDTKTTTEDDAELYSKIYKYKCIMFGDMSFCVIRPCEESYQMQYNAQILRRGRYERKRSGFLSDKYRNDDLKAIEVRKQDEFDKIYSAVNDSAIDESYEGVPDIVEYYFEDGKGIMDSFSELDKFILDNDIDKCFRTEPFYINSYCYLTRRNMLNPAAYILSFCSDWTDKHKEDCIGFRTRKGTGVLNFIFKNEDTDDDYILDDDHEDYLLNAKQRDEFGRR